MPSGVQGCVYTSCAEEHISSSTPVVQEQLFSSHTNNTGSCTVR